MNDQTQWVPLEGKRKRLPRASQDIFARLNRLIDQGGVRGNIAVSAAEYGELKVATDTRFKLTERGIKYRGHLLYAAPNE